MIHNNPVMLHNIYKKVNNSHIVWFGQSNRWVQFEEPAWFVNRLYHKGIDSYAISCRLARKYNIPPMECQAFVDEICATITDLSKPVTVSSSNFNSACFSADYSFVPYSCRHYLIGRKRFALSYETRLAEYCIHPPLAHLEISHSENVDIHYEICNRTDISAIREKNDPETPHVFNDFNRLRKRLFIKMVNAVYHKTNNDWLSFVHASALTDGKQTVLLSSASGSGKSTMAALLQARGLKLVSDDFVPIDGKTRRAFPFPAAISVKEGAFDLLSPYYGNLRDITFNRYEYTHKSVRYLTPKYAEMTGLTARPVKGIVFIRYNPLASCDFTPVPSDEALKLFHEQAWVSGSSEHAEVFLNWFLNLKFVRLEYGNTEDGINKVLGLFEM